MKVYAFVPAKGNSERIENKNKQVLAGEKLYIRALRTLLACKEIDKVFLDTEAQDMYDAVDYLPIEFMKREHKLANNKIDGHQIFMNEVKSFPDADIYVQLLCTSPFIKIETIDNAIKILKENSQYDSAILMKKDKYYFWNNDKPTYDINHIPNSKDLPETLTESMGLYIHKKESALKTNRRYGNNPFFIYGGLDELIDVNNIEDLKFADIFAKGLLAKENQQLQLLKHLASSPMFSDILDDLYNETGIKYGAIINNFSSNLPNTKLLGRATTLKLRTLKQNENFKGIYNALHSYKEIADNNIIVVENELNEYAYFGDLNARLAIRAGASGAIIAGATRDLKQTQNLNFPVFSRSYNAIDVRKRATLDYINKPIKIDNIVINPKDLIFIDECSMVVIYRNTEQEVLKRLIHTVDNEKNIVNDIYCNKNIEEIVANRGTF